MKVGVLKERMSHEKRVAVSPDTVKSLVSLGFDVFIETNAGILAGINDQPHHLGELEGVDEDLIWSPIHHLIDNLGVIRIIITFAKATRFNYHPITIRHLTLYYIYMLFVSK